MQNKSVTATASQPHYQLDLRKIQKRKELLGKGRERLILSYYIYIIELISLINRIIFPYTERIFSQNLS